MSVTFRWRYLRTKKKSVQIVLHGSKLRAWRLKNTFACWSPKQSVLRHNFSIGLFPTDLLRWWEIHHTTEMEGEKESMPLMRSGIMIFCFYVVKKPFDWWMGGQEEIVTIKRITFLHTVRFLLHLLHVPCQYMCHCNDVHDGICWC